MVFVRKGRINPKNRWGTMNPDEIQQKLNDLIQKRLELEEKLKQYKQQWRDRTLQDAIRKELRIVQNKARHLAFKQGKYRYSEDEKIEIAPGIEISANDYHWLKE